MGICSGRALGQFPGHEALDAGPQRVTLLPGRDAFTFTMYGAPGPFEEFEALVRMMQANDLGIGFDPGPGVGAAQQRHYALLRALKWPVVGYAQTSDHQVKEGMCRLTDEQDAILRAHEEAGLFAATQIGEWGYYFHNLSHRESWWRAVYGERFDQWRHLMKPAGLAGYDSMPASRKECHDIVRDYFETRQRAMRGWNLSITGHSHYEAYAGQWGARVIGLELGENIAFTQSKIAFARGAARRNGLPWSVQVSQWFKGSSTSSGALRLEKDGTARGLDAGHSESFYRRLWLHAWFSGAAMLTPESGISMFFEKESPPYRLTRIGEMAARFHAGIRGREQGIPWTPVAVVLDHYCGYNPYMAKPWGVLEPTEGDLEVRDLFEEQLFPGSDHIHQDPFPGNPEASYLRPTPFGELYDVQLSDAPAEILASYPVLLLAGDHDFSEAFVASLMHCTTRGGKLLIAPRHATALGPESLASLMATGKVEVVEPWTHPGTNRTTAISDARLRKLSTEHFPASLSGDPVQFQCNRLKNGWAIKIVNNEGIVKFPTRPMEIREAARARVQLDLKEPGDTFVTWEEGRPVDGRRLLLTLGPGEVSLIAIRRR